jgi:hypothetical protein
MPHIFSETKSISGCSEEEKEAFYRLLCQDFLGVSRQDFIRDFDEKEAVMILRKEHAKGDIVGWSTLMVLTLDLPPEEVKGVFSGDTVVLPEYRSGTGLGAELMRYFLRNYEQYPLHKVYYILTSKGWRTYKIMPFFFKEYAPRYDRPTSSYDQALMDAFGNKKYPGHYHPETGIITYAPQRVRPEGIDAAPPHPDTPTAFFLRRNPGYLEGHELVCAARIAPENFTKIAWRLANLERDA